MRQNLAFITTLWAALALAWLISGERFLDWAFAMPDLGPIDDGILAVVVWAEEAKAALDLPDLFGLWRHWLHDRMGLG